MKVLVIGDDTMIGGSRMAGVLLYHMNFGMKKKINIMGESG